MVDAERLVGPQWFATALAEASKPGEQRLRCHRQLGCIMRLVFKNLHNPIG
jgi:hypothetical protein